MDFNIYQTILNKFEHHYQTIAKTNIEEYAELSKKLLLPFIPPNIITYICHKASTIFETEPTIVQIPAPVSIIGDLHVEYNNNFSLCR